MKLIESILKENIQGVEFRASGMDTIVLRGGKEEVILSRDKDGDIYLKFTDQIGRSWSTHCTYDFAEMQIERSDSKEFFWMSATTTRNFTKRIFGTGLDENILQLLDKKIKDINTEQHSFNSHLEFGRHKSLVFLNRPFISTTQEWLLVAQPCTDAFAKLEEFVSDLVDLN